MLPLPAEGADTRKGTCLKLEDLRKTSGMRIKRREKGQGGQKEDKDKDKEDGRRTRKEMA